MSGVLTMGSAQERQGGAVVKDTHSGVDHPGLTRYQLNDCGQVTLHQPEPPLCICKMGMTVAVAAVMKLCVSCLPAGPAWGPALTWG